MGGSAFLSILSGASFPRLAPPIYQSLKQRLLPRLQELYPHVAVPKEAPGKLDHGDLDFVVASDQEHHVVPHEQVKEALQAVHMIPCAGNRTSNYAIPISSDDVPGEDNKEIYCQVDVHVCADLQEWERVVFLHGYGDLGMILGSIVRRNGLSLGTKGLKVDNQPEKPFDISDDMGSIINFLGLNKNVWDAGFTSQNEIFEWVATSPFFLSGKPFAQLDLEKESRQRRIQQDRLMYRSFVEWAADRERNLGVDNRRFDKSMKEATRDAALNYFGRKDAFDAIIRAQNVHATIRVLFNGNTVGEWTGFKAVGWWKNVKLVMDAVRKKYGGDEGIVDLVEAEGEAGLKRIVLETTRELGLKMPELANTATQSSQ